MKKYRWGIVGTGRMCHTFCRALQLLENAEIAAVCSRSIQKAQQFAEEFGIEGVYDDVLSMAADEKVDIVYIGTPHTDHADSAMAAISCGKAVLCEKPVSINAKQAETVINAAKKKKVFFMEAMWTRFLPAIVKVREWIDEGIIGEVKEVSATLFHKRLYNTEDRTISPKLGGGSLLDVGVYPIFLAQWLLGGRPIDIRSQVIHCENGIDWQSSVLMKFYNGGRASLTCGFEYDANHAEITGSDGFIALPDFNGAHNAYVIKDGEVIRQYSDSDSRDKQYGYQALHVM